MQLVLINLLLSLMITGCTGTKDSETDDIKADFIVYSPIKSINDYVYRLNDLEPTTGVSLEAHLYDEKSNTILFLSEGDEIFITHKGNTVKAFGSMFGSTEYNAYLYGHDAISEGDEVDIEFMHKESLIVTRYTYGKLPKIITNIEISSNIAEPFVLEWENNSMLASKFYIDNSCSAVEESSLQPIQEKYEVTLNLLGQDDCEVVGILEWKTSGELNSIYKSGSLDIIHRQGFKIL